MVSLGHEIEFVSSGEMKDIYRVSNIGAARIERNAPNKGIDLIASGDSSWPREREREK